MRRVFRHLQIDTGPRRFERKNDSASQQLLRTLWFCIAAVARAHTCLPSCPNIHVCTHLHTHVHTHVSPHISTRMSAHRPVLLVWPDRIAAVPLVQRQRQVATPRIATPRGGHPTNSSARRRLVREARPDQPNILGRLHRRAERRRVSEKSIFGRPFGGMPTANAEG